MKFESIKKVQQGKFITRYDVTYTTVDNKTKVYEMISRDNNITNLDDLQKDDVQGVVIIIHDESDEKVILNKEFRMATGKVVYNFPAGLVDPGEDAKISAARELKEETGLDMVEIVDVLPDSYSAVGFSNEVNSVVIGRAKGQFDPSTSTLEEIEAGWYTKEQVRGLLKESSIAARTQAYLYMWCKN